MLLYGFTRIMFSKYIGISHPILRMKYLFQTEKMEHSPCMHSTRNVQNKKCENNKCTQQETRNMPANACR